MSNFRSWFDEQSEEAKEQFLGEYPRLLLDGKEYAKLFKLLSNYYFIEAKINHPSFGVQALIEDYDLLDTSEIRNDSKYTETVKALKLIPYTLFIAGDIISQDQKQLKGQLSARLTYFDLPEIQNLLAQITTDKNIGLYSLRGSLTPPGGGGLIRTIYGHSSYVNAIAVTPDGKSLISGSSDRTIKIWDVVTGAEKFILRGHSDSVNAITVTTDGKSLISASSDETIKIWDVGTGREEFTIYSHSRYVNAIAVTSDGKNLISGSSDGKIKIWDVGTGIEKFTLRGYSGYSNALELTTDGKTLVSGSFDGKIKIWDIGTGAEKFTLKGHSRSITAIALTPDGKTLVSSSFDGKIKIWDLTQKTARFFYLILQYTIFDDKVSGLISTISNDFSSVNAIAVTPDGKTLVSSSFDGKIKIWNLVTGAKEFMLSEHISRINTIILIRNGKTVISYSDDGKIKLWNVVTGEKILNISRNYGIVNYVISLTFSKTALFDVINVINKIIELMINGYNVISSVYNSTIVLWDISLYKTGFLDFIYERIKLILIILFGQSDWVNVIALTPDGKNLISALLDTKFSSKNPLIIIGLHSIISLISYNPLIGLYTRRIKYENTIKIWDLETGTEKFTLQGHSNWVNAIALTPDGQTLISGSDDNTIKIWDLATRKEIATFTGESPITCCAVAPDGVTIVAGEQSGRLHFLRLQGR
ncbi:WD40 repeat domain-containing protein [Dolichospermum sp. UHCC 0299]|uniref:WD40 repeat domain-containing protein n=1 Tax=Dolichospermum sp. UHCC 0299 TaxID=2590014 RepID=UPI001447D885|nr:WD40 repeat domain-containing protein [Dolichospermum sp. UHCC 0299]MTJ15633.1 WD40 repeat domain-containing protein [Dolichospermum sp. UHCC 0299]